MKFVVIGPVSPVRGGIAYHTTELCKHLQKEHSVTVFSLERLYKSFIHRLLYNGNSTLENNAASYHFKKKTTLSINPFSWLISALQIRKLKPDHVILTWADPYLIPLLLTIRIFLPRRTKLALICHELAPQEGRHFDTFLNKLAFRMPQAIIVHSQKDVNRVKKMTTRAKVVKMFLPIYDFFSGEMNQKTSKRQLGLTGPVLLFFGYIREYKGLIHLIDALPSVLKKKPVTLLVVGEFWDDKNQYINRITELKIEQHVKIVDKYIPDDEVPLYFSAADILVAPYLSAAQSGVINVAYAFDKPVIATDVGGLSEIVQNGRTGYVVKPRSSKALADAIIKINENDSDKFKANIKQLKQDLSWDRFYTTLLKNIK